MRLNDIADNSSARKAKKRIGRGPGSGQGRTAGRGMKGQNSRSGVSLQGFEGGQMPLYRRLPKRGFTNPTRKRFAEVNLGRLQVAIDAGKLDPKKTIDGAALVTAGVLRRVHDGIRVLAKGELKAKITIEAVGASKAAAAAIEKAGGKIIEPSQKIASGKTAQGKKQASAKAGDAEGGDAADSASAGGNDEASR